MILNKNIWQQYCFLFIKQNLTYDTCQFYNNNKISEGNKNENKNRHRQSLPESIYDHCYMYSHFILQYVHAFSTLNWARTKLWRLVSNWILCPVNHTGSALEISLFLALWSAAVLDSLSSTSALLLSCKFRYHTWRACLSHGAWNTK